MSEDIKYVKKIKLPNGSQLQIKDEEAATLSDVTALINDIKNTVVYTQNLASMQWTIQHNLGKYPSSGVVDSAGTIVQGDVKYDSLNQVTITFQGPFSGKAFLN